MSLADIHAAAAKARREREKAFKLEGSYTVSIYNLRQGNGTRYQVEHYHGAIGRPESFKVYGHQGTIRVWLDPEKSTAKRILRELRKLQAF